MTWKSTMTENQPREASKCTSEHLKFQNLWGSVPPVPLEDHSLTPPEFMWPTPFRCLLLSLRVQYWSAQSVCHLIIKWSLNILPYSDVCMARSYQLITWRFSVNSTIYYKREVKCMLYSSRSEQNGIPNLNSTELGYTHGCAWVSQDQTFLAEKTKLSSSGMWSTYKFTQLL